MAQQQSSQQKEGSSAPRRCRHTHSRQSGNVRQENAIIYTNTVVSLPGISTQLILSSPWSEPVLDPQSGRFQYQTRVLPDGSTQWGISGIGSRTNQQPEMPSFNSQVNPPAPRPQENTPSASSTKRHRKHQHQTHPPVNGTSSQSNISPASKPHRSRDHRQTQALHSEQTDRSRHATHRASRHVRFAEGYEEIPDAEYEEEKEESNLRRNQTASEQCSQHERDQPRDERHHVTHRHSHRHHHSRHRRDSERSWDER
ncbi:hypothetical protein F5Y16DRAFT_378262 [Xylariaceae sp. FL0255]|nr:hypothetical protein F5Y16DRAFT_378262 [Xylariaceae sp. FL0255]